MNLVARRKLINSMALALSLLKRARDLVIGLPAIGIWQAVEGNRLWRRRTGRIGELPPAD